MTWCNELFPHQLAVKLADEVRCTYQYRIAEAAGCSASFDG
jgi:hypothetical protein